MAGEPSEQGGSNFGDIVRSQVVEELPNTKEGVGLNSK